MIHSFNNLKMVCWWSIPLRVIRNNSPLYFLSFNQNHLRLDGNVFHKNSCFTYFSLSCHFFYQNHILGPIETNICSTTINDRQFRIIRLNWANNICRREYIQKYKIHLNPDLASFFGKCFKNYAIHITYGQWCTTKYCKIDGEKVDKETMKMQYGCKKWMIKNY